MTRENYRRFQLTRVLKEFEDDIRKFKCVRDYFYYMYYKHTIEKLAEIWDVTPRAIYDWFDNVYSIPRRAKSIKKDFKK